MKHISLLNRGTSSNARSSTFGRQLLVDEDDDYYVNDVVNFPYNDNHIEAVEEIDGEGTECVIGTRTPTAIGSIGNVTDTTATNRYIDDDEFHPPMCGQLFLTKVIRNNGGGGGGITRNQQSKTKELISPRRSYNRRNPMLRLTQNKKKNQLTKIVMSGVGYHETFSAEQSPDSESETSSVQSFNDRVRALSTTTHTSPNATAAAGSHDSRHRQSSSSNRSCGGDSDTTTGSSLPSHIVQFDPSELELIKTEKLNADKNTSNNLTSMSSDKPSEVVTKNPADSCTSSLLEMTENQSATTKTKVGGGGGKQSHTGASTLSSFQTTLLPTVAEEKSFDLIESPSSSSAASNYKLVTSIVVSSDQKTSNLLPTASSSFSSGDENEDASAFFGCNTSHQGNRDVHDDSVNADDDENRDDRETVAMSQFGCFTPTNQEKEAFVSSAFASNPNHNSLENVPQESKQRNREVDDKIEAKNLKSTQKDSPEMMEILDAMRQIILKQQDAIQAISDENVEFRNQLAICHREMKTLQGESSDQLVQITQLVIQKNSSDVETTQLKNELGRLKDEILLLKSDDADLVNRFESLMNNHDDTTDDDTTVDKVDRIVVQFNKQLRDRHNISPLKHTNDHTSDNESWRQILGPPDDTSSTSMGRNDVEQKNAKSSMTEETVDSTIVEAETSSSTNSASIATGIETMLPVLETAKIANNATPPSKPLEHHVSKDKDVAEFKNRLGEIQKKRMMRTGSSASKDNSNHTDANSKDRKTFTVRFL